MEGEDKYYKMRKQLWRLIMLVCVLLGVNLLLLGGAMWVLLSSRQALPELDPKVEPEVAVVRHEQVESQKPVETESDDLLVTAAERAAELAVVRDREEHRMKQVDAVAARQKKEESRIPGYVITERGMTLRSLARRYYGSNVFWVCIYDRNMEVLSSPDALPSGIRLFLPRPADYGIDANDPSSLQRARKLGQSLLKQ